MKSIIVLSLSACASLVHSASLKKVSDNVPDIVKSYLDFVATHGVDGTGADDDESLLFKIVNGSPVTNNVPWFASINVISNVQADGSATVGLCGGSLISNNVILTAAHCFYNTDNNQYVKPAQVTLGNGGDTVPNIIVQIGGLERQLTKSPNAPPSSTPFMFRGGAQVICNPNYNADKQQNDICIVKLSAPTTNTPVPLNFVTPTRTAAQVAANEAAGSEATALGFGDTAYKGQTAAALMKTTMPLVPIPQCQKAWNAVFTGDSTATGPGEELINNKVICADSTVSDTCQGDSGGPLLNTKAGALIGITSLGIDCASGVPGVYTRISAFQDWITSVVQI